MPPKRLSDDEIVEKLEDKIVERFEQFELKLTNDISAMKMAS